MWYGQDMSRQESIGIQSSQKAPWETEIEAMVPFLAAFPSALMPPFLPPVLQPNRTPHGLDPSGEFTTGPLPLPLPLPSLPFPLDFPSFPFPTKSHGHKIHPTFFQMSAFSIFALATWEGRHRVTFVPSCAQPPNRGPGPSLALLT